MDNAAGDPPSVTVSVRIFRALLAVYPSEFRQAYGGPMLQVFCDSSRRAVRTDGGAGLLLLWWRTLADTLQAAIEQHAQREVEMSREKFYRLSGWALMAGPVLFLIGGWANNRPRYSPYNAASLPIDRYANGAAVPLIVAGLVFISLGLLGLLLRYSPKRDGAGFLLGVSVLAGLASAVGAAVLAVNDNNPWWTMFLLGMLIQYIALAGFGFVTVRRRLLPRWNGLPILALWFPAAILLSLGITPWEVTIQIFAALWTLTCVMFAGLGYLLQSNPPPAGAAAAAE